MKPVNWISATGRNPSAARPTDMPAISSSASGVSMTRVDPKRCCKPSVARKTPPLTPTSSPRTRTRSSTAISCASARLTAWMRERSGMIAGSLDHLIALRCELERQLGIKMIEHRLRRLGLQGEVFFDGGLHLAGALREKLLLVRLGPRTGIGEISSETHDRLQLPMTADLGIVAIAARVVDRRVIAETIGERLDDRGTLAGARLFNGASRCVGDGDDVITVDLLTGNAGGDSLLRQGLSRRLRGTRHRNGPLVVGDHEHHRQPHGAGKIDRFIEVALRGAAIADAADGDTALASELH